MGNSITRFLERRRQIGAEQRLLDEKPQLPCSSNALRILTTGDVSALLNNPETEGRWTQVDADLRRACRIDDGTTGGVNPGDRRALWYLIHGLGARSVLEIGTHVGASTVHIASAMKSLPRADPSARPHLTTVDVEDVNSESAGAWKKYGLTSPPAAMIEAIDSTDLVTFVTQSSLAFLAECADTFDFVFLDGDHAADTVYQEIPGALKVLKKNGTILLHDYFPGNKPLWAAGPIVPGPYLAARRLRREGARFMVLPLGDLPWPTKAGSRTTSLALLVRA